MTDKNKLTRKYYVYQPDSKLTVHEGIEGLLAWIQNQNGEIIVIEGTTIFHANVKKLSPESEGE